MTRKKTDAKKPADANPEADQPVEQAGGAAEAAGAPGAADGADGAPVGDAAPGADGGGKADETAEAGADVPDIGTETGGGTTADGAAGDAGTDVEGEGAPVNQDDYWPTAFSTQLDESNRMLAMVADEAARVASYGMVRVNISFDTFDPDATTQGPKMAGPDHLMLEVKALADKIGERATPEVCWTHVKLAGVLSGREMMDWDRTYFMVFVSVYLELKKAADQHRARVAAENAPAPPKKKIDPEDLTTGTVEGFGATIKTQ